MQLLKVVQERVRPKYHVFGHIHEGERGGKEIEIIEDQ